MGAEDRRRRIAAPDPDGVPATGGAGRSGEAGIDLDRTHPAPEADEFAARGGSLARNT